MANNNPQFYQECFDRQEAAACIEQVRLDVPEIDVRVYDHLWHGKTSESHQDGEYLYTSVNFYWQGRFVTHARNEHEVADLFALAAFLTGKQVNV